MLMSQGNRPTERNTDEAPLLPDYWVFIGVHIRDVDWLNYFLPFLGGHVFFFICNELLSLVSILF